MSVPTDYVQVKCGSGLVRIALDRPDRRNALTPAMLDAVARAARAAADDDSIGAILFTGHGRSFCAGFDLDLCRDHPDGSMMRSLLTALSETIRTLRALPIPVVIAAHGAAIAGGCALLSGGDLVVSHPDAKLGYPVTRLGISPAVNAAALLEDLGPGPVRRLLLDPGLLSGADAHRIGLVTHLEPHADACLKTAETLAKSLAGKPRHAMTETRRWARSLASRSGADADAGSGPVGDASARGLAVSLALTGSEEERTLLARVWKTDR